MTPTPPRAIPARRGTSCTTAAAINIRSTKTASANTRQEARPTFRTRSHEAGSRDYFHDLLESPFGNEITLEAARLIIADEQLGKDEFPDVLGINLTPNDYVGHAYGPESLEVEDITYRTDRMLGEFADFVNERLEGRHWILVVTADHGVTPIPELAARWKLAAKRNPFIVDKNYRPGPASQMLEAYLRRKLGVRESEPSLVQAFTDIQVYLREDHPALKGTRFAEAQRATRDWLLSQDCVAAAVTREQCLSGGATGRTEAMLRRSFHPRRSGDVLICAEAIRHRRKQPRGARSAVGVRHTRSTSGDQFRQCIGRQPGGAGPL